MNSKLNIENFDIYSKKICFFYNNHEKISSYFGFFLTLIYIFASLILFLFQIVRAIQRKELKVYESTIYSKEMPLINVDMNQLYFAFGLEYPSTATRYIDESIYTAKITFFDQQKIKDKFETIVKRDLEFEKCNVDNFGKDYQNLFVKDELNNSYCLKNFNYTLPLAGSYKYDRITYIRIVINPCVNSTKNNFSCKTQEEIDKQLNSGYFSIVLKDFGLNPSNYSSPRIPTLQDLYTTIDRRLAKNYILNFGLTHIKTDSGIITENLKEKIYLQFRKVFENFSLREEKDYHSGKSVILVQLRLEDTLFIQTRTYLKISEIFSRIGGYMQLMNTIFLLITSIINRIYSEIKIINGIFNFNIKENKMILKLETFKDSNKILNSKNIRHLILSSKKFPVDIKQSDADCKSKNNLIIKDNNFTNISSLNFSDNNKNVNESRNYSIKHSKKSNIIYYENSKNNYIKSRNDNVKTEEPYKNMQLNKESFLKSFYSINKGDYNYMDFNERINLNLLDYFCPWINTQKYNDIKLYNKGNEFYRKKMDIVHVFTLLTIIEDFIKRQS